MALSDIFGGPDTSAAQSAMRGGIQAVKKGAKQAYGFLDTGVTEAQPYLQQSVDAFAPYNAQGQGANTMLSNALGLGGEAGSLGALNAFQNSPGYAAALERANQNVLRNQAFTGGLNGGGTLLALSKNAQDLQNLDWQNWINNLSGLSGRGIQGATGMGTGLTNLGNLFSERGQNKANVATGAASNIAGLKNQYGSNVTAANTASDQMWAGILSGLLGAGAKVAGGYFG